MPASCFDRAFGGHRQLRIPRYQPGAERNAKTLQIYAFQAFNAGHVSFYHRFLPCTTSAALVVSRHSLHRYVHSVWIPRCQLPGMLPLIHLRPSPALRQSSCMSPSLTQVTQAIQITLPYTIAVFIVRLQPHVSLLCSPSLLPVNSLLISLARGWPLLPSAAARLSQSYANTPPCLQVRDFGFETGEEVAMKTGLLVRLLPNLLLVASCCPALQTPLS